MTNYATTPPSATDSERAAGFAALCLREGRLQLAISLTRIALAAEQTEQDPRPIASDPEPAEIPAAGRAALRAVDPIVPGPPAIFEQLSQPGRVLQPPPAVPIVPAHQPETAIMDAASIRAAVEDAAGRVFHDGPTAGRKGVPDARRCGAVLERGGSRDQCRLAIYWSTEQNDWRHIHSDADTDHDASALAQS